MNGPGLPEAVTVAVPLLPLQVDGTDDVESVNAGLTVTVACEVTVTGPLHVLFTS